MEMILKNIQSPNGSQRYKRYLKVTCLKLFQATFSNQKTCLKLLKLNDLSGTSGSGHTEFNSKKKILQFQKFCICNMETWLKNISLQAAALDKQWICKLIFIFYFSEKGCPMHFNFFGGKCFKLVGPNFEVNCMKNTLGQGYIMEALPTVSKMIQIIPIHE